MEGRLNTGLGRIFREARTAQGISREALAYELSLSLRILEAIETEDWEKVPPGRERPLARLLARRLGIDLDAHTEAWETLPGISEQEVPNPRRETAERLLMAALTAGSLGLLAWLVIPGRSLKSGTIPPQRSVFTLNAPRWAPPKSDQPYPVLGEVLPEAPVTEQGILVSLRAMDTCEARIEAEDGTMLRQTLRVSEPWRLRVKGAFALFLDNAGVVNLEVAGRRIRHGANVAEAWTGRFGEDGRWILPTREESETPPTAPETDAEAPPD